MNTPIYLFSISSNQDAIHINPLEIDFFHPNIAFENYDYLIITSKQIAQVLRFYEYKGYEKTPALCISKQSAKSFEAIGGEILSLGRGYGDTLIEEIEKFDKSKKWLYLRAQEVASDFVQVCKNKGYNIDEVVLYKSECAKSIASQMIEKQGVLIFTSPSSVECFLKHHSFTPAQKVVVIGKTTQRKIPKGVDVTLSEEKTVQSCVEIAKKLAK